MARIFGIVSGLPKCRKRVFGWRLAREALATEKGRCRRTLTPLPTCTICGMEDEDGFHAVVRCTKARSLRDAVREVWELPKEDMFRYSGTRWLQVLLNSVNDDTRTKILLLFWRACHLRNDLIHGKGVASVTQSVGFLKNYVDTLFNIRQTNRNSAGKEPVYRDPAPSASSRLRWVPPPAYWAKLNCDAAYDDRSGEAYVGCVIRNCNGDVLLSAWMSLQRCSTALEAESMACSFASTLAREWVLMPTIVESCSELIDGLSSNSWEKARHGYLLSDIKRTLAEFPEYKFSPVNRGRNRVAHELAQVAKRGVQAAVLRLDSPPFLAELLQLDCKGIIA